MVVAVIGACALLSACARAASPAPTASGPTAARASAPAAPSAGASASGTKPASASPGASSLRVSADVDLGASSAQAKLVAAEGPDGAVFYAAGQVVMVVDGTSPPQAAEHPGAQVLGLGASSATLYVVTPKALLAYSRSTGNQTGRWALTGSPATPTTAGVTVGGNGDVWVWTDWATDFSGYENAMVYAVLPGVATADVVSTEAEPGTLTTDGTHGFFLVAAKSDLGASLMQATPSPGASPDVSLTTASTAPTQALVGFSGSQVVLYSQPDSLYTFTPGSAGTIFMRTDAGQPVVVAGTGSGLLFLTCSKRACSTVTRVDQSSGKAGTTVTLPASGNILLGPSPAVLGVEAGHLHLVRLG